VMNGGRSKSTGSPGPGRPLPGVRCCSIPTPGANRSILASGASSGLSGWTLAVSSVSLQAQSASRRGAPKQRMRKAD